MRQLAGCWPKNMPKLVDTNLIVRFLVNDNSKQAQAAEKVFKENELILTDVALAEVVWTLQSFYKLPRQEIIDKIYRLLQSKSFIFNRELLLNSLFKYLNYKISFVDAYLIAYVEINKMEGLYSFDEGLDKVKTVTRFKP